MFAGERSALAARLFREGARGLTAEQKERLFAILEEEAWSLPDEVFQANDWEEHALGDMRVRAALEKALAAVERA